MSKVARKSNSFPELDLSKPLQRSAIYIPPDDCFGKEWDAYDKSCQVCADCDVCGILFSDLVKKKVHEVELQEKNRGAAFLDTAEMFRNLDGLKDKMSKLVIKRDATDNPLTVEDLVEYVKDKYNISDDVAIKEWIKTFVKGDERICIKERKFRVKG